MRKIRLGNRTWRIIIYCCLFGGAHIAAFAQHGGVRLPPCMPDMPSYCRKFVEEGMDFVTHNDVLMAHPAIRRVDPGTRLDAQEKYADFSERDTEAYRKLHAWSQERGIEAIVVDRFGGKIDGKIAEVKYVIYRRGNVTVDGCYATISYIDDPKIIGVLKESGDEVTPLGKEHWFFVWHAGH